MACSAHHMEGFRGGLGKLVDVGPCAGAGAFGGDTGYNLRILRVRRPIDGVSDGNRGLASARDHVVVVRIQLLQMVQVNTGHHKGAYRRRGHIKHNFARLSEDGCVLHMCSGSRSVKDNPDFRVPRHCLNAFDGGLKPQARSPPDSLRLHDARHGLHLQVPAAHYLVH